MVRRHMADGRAKIIEYFTNILMRFDSHISRRLASDVLVEGVLRSRCHR